jgi:hypothetical protein
VNIAPVFGWVYETWSFANSGIIISGNNYYGLNKCLGFLPTGSSCDPSIFIVNSGLPQPNIGTVSGSNSMVLFLGGVNISGASFPSASG